eukprot:COSAG06_NODE_19351_length_842_cov_1.581427_1_plen_69_part_01
MLGRPLLHGVNRLHAVGSALFADSDDPAGRRVRAHSEPVHRTFFGLSYTHIRKTERGNPPRVSASRPRP